MADLCVTATFIKYLAHPMAGGNVWSLYTSRVAHGSHCFITCRPPNDLEA